MAIQKVLKKKFHCVLSQKTYAAHRLTKQSSRCEVTVTSSMCHFVSNQDLGNSEVVAAEECREIEKNGHLFTEG